MPHKTYVKCDALAHTETHRDTGTTENKLVKHYEIVYWFAATPVIEKDKFGSAGFGFEFGMHSKTKAYIFYLYLYLSVIERSQNIFGNRFCCTSPFFLLAGAVVIGY